MSLKLANIAILSVIVVMLSCTKKIDKPQGSENAKSIYNQAYQENFDADQVKDIISSAKNAYILLDPFQENIRQHVSILKNNGNELGAYISIGTGEDWRADFSAMKPFLVTKQWGEWQGEYFVDKTNTGVLDIMKLRIDQIADWGFDWVEFDNMDWAFDDESRTKYGFEVKETEATNYYNELCEYVHEKAMKCMAKNTVLEANTFDGALYESFHNNKNWWETKGAQKFLNEGKLVIVNHYNEPNCNKIYSEYIDLYNADISFICEDRKLKRYVHFND